MRAPPYQLRGHRLTLECELDHLHGERLHESAPCCRPSSTQRDCTQNHIETGAQKCEVKHSANFNVVNGRQILRLRSALVQELIACHHFKSESMVVREPMRRDESTLRRRSIQAFLETS